jgi:branched-chain amino acid transport system substrate-binding protein
MTKKIFIAIGVIAVVAIGVFVWLNNKQNSMSKETVNIAAILSLTGSGAEYGNDQLRTIELVKESLKKSTNKYNYEFIIQDSKSMPKDAIQALNNILATHKVDVAMTILSTVCLSLQPITEKNSIPFFCVGSIPGITKESNLVFRSLPTSDYQTKSLVKNYFFNKTIKSVSIVYLNDDYGIGNVQSFKGALQAYEGIQILQEEAINANAISNSRILLSKIIKEKPECLFIAFYSKSLANILRQLKELNYEGQILTPIEISYPEVLDLAGDAADNVIFIGNSTQSQGEESSKFVDDYLNKYNTRPTLDAFYAFDEIQVIINTIEQNGYSLEAFKQLKGNAEFNSPNGHFKINSLGDFEYDLKLFTIKNREIIEIR